LAVERRAAAHSMALLLLGADNISQPHRAQQQNGCTLRLRSNDETDGRTDGGCSTVS